MSTLSPNHECKQFKGLTRDIRGGSLLALRGIVKEFSSVTNVRASSKSANDGALKDIERTRDIPGAMSPCTFEGYLTFLMVKLSLLIMNIGKLNVLFTWLEE